ncbi:MAG TPA: Mur ligase family protein [Thermomicrobiales bacterium]|nr:Mur ligase family protein [Thermomicrobiales bacterium]
MEIVEIRDLDGPNLFLLRPAIKLEVAFGAAEEPLVSRIAEAFVAGEVTESRELVPGGIERVLVLLAESINVLHDRLGVERPEMISRWMETPGHYVVAYSWERRKLGRDLAHIAFELVAGKLSNADLDVRLAAMQHHLVTPAKPGDEPEYLRDTARHLPIIGITGTNGKTTTTRLVSAVLMNAGHRVGWTSTAGVFVQGEERVKGDFTGPGGAAHVLKEPDLEFAVLETARGGILLRGIGYESNDVSVVTNISPDHLGLHGVQTVEGLAEVKAVVARVTRPEGFVVLNADDPLVLAMRESIVARPFLISRDDENPAVREHVAAGGWALTVQSGQIAWFHEGLREIVTDLADVPVTFGGRAAHMVENALCGTAACIAIGLPIDQVRAGLAAFQPSAEHNRGRLNVFDVQERTYIIDYAHNEAGLVHLIALGRSFASERNARLIAIIGSAGDRTDNALRILGSTSARSADLTIIKETNHYLRGREKDEITRFIKEGMTSEGVEWAAIASSEFDGVQRAFELSSPGDVIVVMSTEDYDDILAWFEEMAEERIAPETGS